MSEMPYPCCSTAYRQHRHGVDAYIQKHQTQIILSWCFLIVTKKLTVHAHSAVITLMRGVQIPKQPYLYSLCMGEIDVLLQEEFLVAVLKNSHLPYNP